MHAISRLSLVAALAVLALTAAPGAGGATKVKGKVHACVVKRGPDRG